MPAQNLHKADEGGNYLHVFNKGIENRAIFRDEDDFRTFLAFLEEYLSARKDAESTKKEFSVNGQTFRGVPHQPKNYLGKIELLAYSLKPDSFHLLLHQKTKKSLQGLIRSLCTRYSIYFNKKYKHTGGIFEGPYKSVTINEKDLPILTLHLHRNGVYSSYQEYLKLKSTPWVRTKVVLSLENGDRSYKDFVEKHRLSDEEKDLLAKIVIEKNHENPDNLERSNLARNSQDFHENTSIQPSEDIYEDLNLSPFQRIPEFLGTSVIFILLLFFGFRNVSASTIQSPQPVTLGEKTEVSITKGPQQEEPSLNPSTSSAVLGAKSQNILVIDTKDASASVNIRRDPMLYSKIIDTTKNGETFEFVSVNEGWYKVKLASDSSSMGFISAEYVVEEHR